MNSDIGNNLPLIYNHLLSCGLGPIFNAGCRIRLSPMDTATLTFEGGVEGGIHITMPPS